MNTNHFISYINDNGIYCHNNVVEEFLLSFKVNDKILLNGFSSNERYKFFESFIKYYFEINDLNNKIKSNFKVGKTITSKGFAVKRGDVLKILPKIKYEDKCDFMVEGIKVNAHLNLTPRLFFKPSDNKEFYDYLEEVTENNIEKLDYEIILDDSDSLNYKVFNARHFDKEYEDIIDFIKEAKLNSTSYYFIIFNNVTDENINLLLFYGDEIPANLTIFYNGQVNNYEDVVDDVAIINFSPISPMDYLQNNLSNIKFKNISYLESPQKEYLGNVNDIKKHLQNIYVSKNKSLYNILVDELNRLYHILANDDIYISPNLVNSILKYMIISWKYEDCPDIFNNWYKYFDFQIIQRVFPLLNEDVSIETLDSLVEFCSNEYNYHRSYSKIMEMI